MGAVHSLTLQLHIKLSYSAEAKILVNKIYMCAAIFHVHLFQSIVSCASCEEITRELVGACVYRSKSGSLCCLRGPSHRKHSCVSSALFSRHYLKLNSAKPPYTHLTGFKRKNASCINRPLDRCLSGQQTTRKFPIFEQRLLLLSFSNTFTHRNEFSCLY